MKKLMLFLILLMITPVFASTSAFDIQWWNQATYSNLPSNTLRQWAEGMQGRVGSNLGTGSIFYVDSGVVNEGDGSSWENAKDTLQEAVDLCVVNRGDVIKVAQGTAEDVATAAAIDVDCNGITIEGVGNGDERPEFSLTTNLSTFQVSASDVTLYNLRFKGAKTSGGSAQGVDVLATANGYRILGCEFRETSNDTELVKMLNITANADEGVIAGNRFIGETGGGDAVAITFEGGSDKTVIAYNTLIGDWSGYVVDGTTAASTEISVYGNYVHNADTGAGKTIAFNSSTTGGIFGNQCYGNGATFELVGDAMFISPDNVVMQTENVEGRNYESMLGAFTGPADGAAQDDNVKASLDLLNTDTATTIALVGDVNTNIIADITALDQVVDDVNTNIIAVVDAILLDTAEIQDVNTNIIADIAALDQVVDDVNTNLVADVAGVSTLVTDANNNIEGYITALDQVVDDVNTNLVADFTNSGSQFIIIADVNCQDLVNNTQDATSDITTAASGDLYLENITLSVGPEQAASLTTSAWAVFEISCDNTHGQTGEDAPIVAEVVASFTELTTIAEADMDTSAFPILIESGSTLYCHGSNAAGNVNGVVRVTLVFRRIDDAAAVTALDVGTIP